MSENATKTSDAEVGGFFGVLISGAIGGYLIYALNENGLVDEIPEQAFFLFLVALAFGFSFAFWISGGSPEDSEELKTARKELSATKGKLTKLKNSQQDRIKEAVVEEVAESEKWYEAKIEELGEETIDLERQILNLKNSSEKPPQLDSQIAALEEEVQNLKQEVIDAQNARGANTGQLVELESQLERERDKTKELLDDRLSGLAIPAFTQLFDKRLDQLTTDDLKGENHSYMLTLYDKMKSVYADNGLIDIDKLANAKGEIGRISQYEAIIDHFSNLINRANKDESLDEEIREEKVNAYRRLMDREISAMEGAS